MCFDPETGLELLGNIEINDRKAMMKSNDTEPMHAVLTERMDTDSPEFTEFQALLLNKSRAQTKLQKRAVELAAIRSATQK